LGKIEDRPTLILRGKWR